ncbi:hypothetical protein QBC32DRAFT_380493 [Pseudoneurospora amorphoporcata]|uniref:DUF6594 domain-containing protein n=1 Tax=Pseudoneurospora amorphoporcata TaxID=241081 RepID=A0AAN6SI50_9PEZI|nr:hypothetical protein QBC32DRAFT_380493 [Pseudoneurospora amorphoporcata]
MTSSEKDQQSVRSVDVIKGMAEVLEANDKSWSIDLERGETRTEGKIEKEIDGIELEPYPNLDYIDSEEEPSSYVNMQVTDAPDGYPMLARFISSHEDGYIFREFRYLQSRTLLHMQDELRALEVQLHRMDQFDAKHRATLLKTREVDDDRLGRRGRLMEEIAEKLKKYGMNIWFPLVTIISGASATSSECELLTISNNLANTDRPSHFDLQSLDGFFKAKEPLVRHERYLGCQSDLITLKAGRDDAWLDRRIIQLLVKYNCAPLRFIFANAHTKTFSDNKHTPLNLFSMARVHFLKMVILILLMLCLLCLPIIPLYSWTQGGGGDKADDDAHSAAVTGQTLAKIMGLIVACAFAFGVVLSICTRAKKHEIFGSCAAYMAVLIVFMTTT